MEIEYTATLWIPQEDIKMMQKKVQKGDNPDLVYDEWRVELPEDTDFYAAGYPKVKEIILKEITKKG